MLYLLLQIPMENGDYYLFLRSYDGGITKEFLYKIKAIIVALLICTFMIGIPTSYSRTVTPYATLTWGWKYQ